MNNSPAIRRLTFFFLSLVLLLSTGAIATEPAGAMAQGRYSFASVPLADGRALVAGGYGATGLMTSAEIFDLATAAFSSTGAMTTPRGSPAGARLADGRVLVVGGSGPGDANNGTLPLASAEIFDPATGAWSATGSMAAARRTPVALTLPDGRVLVVGGDATILTTEVYDPVSGTFSSAGSLNAGRADFAAAVLGDGRVFVAGGSSSTAGVHHASAEAWDPVTGAWALVGSMAQSRVGAAATVLADGSVLVSGGQTGISSGIFVSAAERFDPTAGTFTVAASLATARAEHTSTRLPDGRVLIAGGKNASNALAPIEIYDPVADVWQSAGNLTTARRRHASVLLGNGKVLIAGGLSLSFSTLSAAELADPACLVAVAALSPSSGYFIYMNGTGSIAVTHVTGCSWKVTGVPSWITINSGSSGSGSGTIDYSVAGNAGPAARNATLSIGGTAFPVTQEGNPCATASLTPSNQSFTNAAGSSSVNVSIAEGCPWAVAGAPAWVSIASSGTGPTSLPYSVTANGGVARSASFTIANSAFSVNQAAGTCSPASTISPSSRFIGSAGGSSSVTVTAASACAWTVTGAPSWITIASSGTGNATLSFSVAANAGGVERSAVLNVAGNNFTVTQSANLCVGAALSPSSLALPNSSTTGTIALTAPAGCSWTITNVPLWMVFTSGSSGTGSATLTYQSGTNNGPAQSATLSIAGVSLPVSQAAGSCWPNSTVSPASTPQFPAGGGSATVSVTAQPSCTWSVTSLPSWITVTSSVPATGSGTVSFTAAANTGAARSFTMVIAGATHSVSQAAGPCAGTTVSPISSATFATAGGSGSVTVNTQAGCTWSVTSVPSWVTVTSAMPVTGSGTVTYTVAANSGSARSGALVAAGATHTVSQSGITTSYCTSRGTTSSYEWVQSIAFNGVTRSSGNNGGYGDFTATPTVSLTRSSNTFTLTPGFSSGSYTEYWRIWIDLNGDNVFSDSELVYGGSSNGAIASSFTMPATALSGTTRMRISMKYGGSPLACGNFTYGEVEDYLVAIP